MTSESFVKNLLCYKFNSGLLVHPQPSYTAYHLTSPFHLLHHLPPYLPFPLSPPFFSSKVPDPRPPSTVPRGSDFEPYIPTLIPLSSPFTVRPLSVPGPPMCFRRREVVNFLMNRPPHLLPSLPRSPFRSSGTPRGRFRVSGTSLRTYFRQYEYRLGETTPPSLASLCSPRGE